MARSSTAANYHENTQQQGVKKGNTGGEEKVGGVSSGWTRPSLEGKTSEAAQFLTIAIFNLFKEVVFLINPFDILNLWR